MNRPQGPPPPHLSSVPDLAALQGRVQEKYGAFGARPEEVGDERILADGWLAPTLKLVAAVAVASLFLSFVSHPSWDGPGAWTNSFRVDSVFFFLWAPLLWFAVVRFRLWKSLRVYLVLSLFIEAFSEAMFREMGGAGYAGYWDTFLWPAAVGYFGTIKELTGMPGASLPVFALVTLTLFVRAMRARTPADETPPPPWARAALLVFLATVVGLAALGIARGGGIEPAFRQTLHLLQLPLVTAVFLYGLRIPRDLAFVGTAFVAVAFVRSLLVAFVYFAICMPQGITELPGKPEWCTTHSDSVLFVTALVILMAYAVEQRSAKTIRRCIAIGVVITAGIVLNNRRLAFVSLAAAPLVLYLALRPSKQKRRVTAALAVLVPLLIGYITVGSEVNSTSPVLKPAKLIMSMIDQKDTSAQSRDVENANLIYTLHQNPVVMTGFGHEYEYSPDSPPIDLSEVFSNYRYIAHNGVLWLWSLGGVLGFTLMWLLYPLAGTMGVRAYRAATTPLERSAALATVGTTVVCVVQIWGDQGFNSYLTMVTFGVAFAVASRLAVRSGSAPA